jgi:NAD(P)H dehydrogenase (quinone)
MTQKKFLIVLAHPESKSLNAALKDVAVDTCLDLGHEVLVSDLYATRWKAVADGEDFELSVPPERLQYARASKEDYRTGSQREDIAREQEKLLWADGVIFQFPLWWYSMPAILKGWIDRTYAFGFAYGLGEHHGEKWGIRYGEGTLRGRRAMLSVTIGGRAPQYGARGINGSLEDILFPINHGVLFYPGMQVLPPFAVYEATRMPDDKWPAVAEAYRERLRHFFSDDPIPYRRQNGGHYDERQVLKPGLAAGEHGNRLHLLQPGEPPQRPLETQDG